MLSVGAWGMRLRPLRAWGSLMKFSCTFLMARFANFDDFGGAFRVFSTMHESGIRIDQVA